MITVHHYIYWKLYCGDLLRCCCTHCYYDSGLKSTQVEGLCTTSGVSTREEMYHFLRFLFRSTILWWSVELQAGICRQCCVIGPHVCLRLRHPDFAQHCPHLSTAYRVNYPN